MSVNGRRYRTVGGMSCPERNDFALDPALLTSSYESVPQVVQVVIREKVLDVLRQNAGRNFHDLCNVDKRHNVFKHRAYRYTTHFFAFAFTLLCGGNGYPFIVYHCRSEFGTS